MPTTPRNKVLQRDEESGGVVAIVESTMVAGVPGPPLHAHAFDEAFYLLDGDLTFQPGFEREFARRAANEAGVKPPDWALQQIPEITYLGGKIGRQPAP